jgi:stearoyl-CoA desaturase (delta-9 desaturase)
MATKKRLNYPSIVLLGSLHLGALWALWYVVVHGVPAKHWMAFAALLVTTMGCVTVGYHRLETHRGFKTVWWVRAILLFCGGLSLQGTAKEWVANHRVHHRFDDQVGFDPHTPLEYPGLKGVLWAHVGWLLVHYQRPEGYRSFSDLDRDRVVFWQHRLYLVPAVTSFLLPLVLFGWSGLLVVGFLRIVVALNLTWSINSVGHVWGTRAKDASGQRTAAGNSRNNALIALATMGEGYHSNHHVRPQWAYHGWKWYDFDPSKWLIAALESCGLAWDVKKPDSQIRFTQRRVLPTGS